MENIQDWAAYLAENGEHLLNNPPTSYASYAPYASYARQALSIVSTARSYLIPLINQVSTKPDLATIALLLIIFFISLKIFNMLLQTLLFWFRMAKSVAFWGGLLGLAVWMYTRGPDGAMEDVWYWYGVWTGEYQRWKEQERLASLVQQQRHQMGAGRGMWD